MNKVFMLLVLGGFIVTGSCYAQTPAPAPAQPAAPAAEATAPEVIKSAHHEHHPELHRALRKLRDAKHDLEKAAHDYDGHRVKAIAAIDHAIDELKAALEVKE